MRLGAGARHFHQIAGNDLGVLGRERAPQQRIGESGWNEGAARHRGHQFLIVRSRVAIPLAINRRDS